jgi:hypothetical protein
VAQKKTAKHDGEWGDGQGSAGDAHSVNFLSAATLVPNGGLPLARPTQMTTTETCRYRGYDIDRLLHA